MNQGSEQTGCVFDEYLNQVAEAMLASGSTAGEIDTAIESLREQIVEMAGPAATPLELESVIATLDPPEAYRPMRFADVQSASVRSGRPRWTRSFGWLSIVLAVGSWVAMFVIEHFSVENEDEGGFVALLFLLTALAAGIVSWRNPVGRFGALTAILFLVLFILILVFDVQ